MPLAQVERGLRHAASSRPAQAVWADSRGADAGTTLAHLKSELNRALYQHPLTATNIEFVSVVGGEVVCETDTADLADQLEELEEELEKLEEENEELRASYKRAYALICDIADARSDELSALVKQAQAFGK